MAYSKNVSKTPQDLNAPRLQKNVGYLTIFVTEIGHLTGFTGLTGLAEQGLGCLSRRAQRTKGALVCGPEPGAGENNSMAIFPLDNCGCCLYFGNSSAPL